jgi:hypothetical protein
MNATRMAVLTASFLITASVWATDERGLEACLNGEVSASGLYPTQAIEDRVRASGQSLDAGQNGEVSASGLYPTQAMEDSALVRSDGVRVAAAHERSLDPCVNGEVSATGSYITQALEDRALRDALPTQVAVR